MDALVRKWTSVSGFNKRIEQNALLLQFLGTWLYAKYQPFPEKPPFWDRLFQWLDHLPLISSPATRRMGARGREIIRQHAQQVLFNFVPWLLFASEEDMVATYRAAYTGPICRWLLQQARIALDDHTLDDKLVEARRSTWFGSLAGMDINTFCRVNGVVGQSYRPEFRFLAKFCNFTKLSDWLKKNDYKRIVIVEDIVGTGTQLKEARRALIALHDFQILLVPLFIAPEGYHFAANLSMRRPCRHVHCDPLFILPHDCLVKRVASMADSEAIAEFRQVNRRYNAGRLGFGHEYGTLVLTHANCPDNVPPIFHERTTARPVPLFRRASRQG